MAVCHSTNKPSGLLTGHVIPCRLIVIQLTLASVPSQQVTGCCATCACVIGNRVIESTRTMTCTVHQQSHWVYPYNDMYCTPTESLSLPVQWHVLYTKICTLCGLCKLTTRSHWCLPTFCHIHLVHVSYNSSILQFSRDLAERSFGVGSVELQHQNWSVTSFSIQSCPVCSAEFTDNLQWICHWGVGWVFLGNKGLERAWRKWWKYINVFRSASQALVSYSTEDDSCIIVKTFAIKVSVGTRDLNMHV